MSTEKKDGLVVITTSVPKEVGDQFRAIAAREHRSQANYLRVLIEGIVKANNVHA